MRLWRKARARKWRQLRQLCWIFGAHGTAEPPRSPEKAGVQGRGALYPRTLGGIPLPRSDLGPGLRRGADTMKQINVFPMLIMLVVIVLIIAYLGGYLR